RAIVSTDNNPFYYDFWPLVAKAWRNIGIEPTVAVVGNLNLNHPSGTIIKVPQIEGISSGFISQVIRFIIPCLFPEEVSVIGDIDMIPLNKDYFTKNIAQYNEDDVVIFSSDAYTTELRYPMCYIAAKGKYFREIIGLQDTGEATIESFIKDLYALDKKWDTDELFFAEQLHKSALLSKTVFLKRGWSPMAKNRIDRSHWKYSKLGLFFNKYIDVHCLRPMENHLKQLNNIVEYVDHGSEGKNYFSYIQKKPAKAFANRLKLLKQNHFDKDLYAIAETINVTSPAKNMIAFSLFGNDALYTANIEKVVKSYHELLPGWKCRVYVAKDVDAKHIDLLSSNGCEVMIMEKTGVDARYTTWRFLAVEAGAEAVIIRDLDSVPTQREKIMIEEWLAADKDFHIIRDHMHHNALVMAGMWGIKKNDISIKKETRTHLLTNTYGVDQVFLEKVIYPRFKNNVLVHDRFPRFPDEDAIIIPFTAEEGFIGEVYRGEVAILNENIS
ncbi:hypothetical protein, partial [uncultured Mucilaginibacter sp.]|uniref:hypothetical protein n=1 Tax=uncultured Mucilaginibacter sp. TaxID=797541 RepID=UPI0025CD875A